MFCHFNLHVTYFLTRKGAGVGDLGSVRVDDNVDPKFPDVQTTPFAVSNRYLGSM